MGGIAYNKLHFDILNSGYYPGLHENSFPASISPTIGGYISLLPKKRVQNYKLSFELYWQAFKSETDSIQANSYTKGKGSVQFSTLNFGPTIQYFLSQSAVKPFVEAGVSIFSTMNLKDDYTYLASSTRYSRKIFDNAGPGLNAVLAAGVQFGKLMAGFRYTPGLSQSHVSGFSLLVKVDIR